IPLPDYKVFRILAYFNDEESVARAIIGIRRERILPEIAEYMDQKTLIAVSKAFNIPVKGVGALLIDVPEFQLNRLLSLLKSLNAEVIVAEDEEKKEELYKVRVFAPIAVHNLASHHMAEDVVVPISLLPEALKKIREIEKEFGLQIPTLGHIGDGNLHPIILYNDGEEEKAKEVFYKLCRYVISVGGSITGEHGVGIQKAELLKEQIAAHNGIRVLDLMKGIKKVFDPYNLLNPGKYVDAP
ncbi:MAG: FAD-linked oxidase C-terminal domain-containing protein, partial [Sulfolobaceae archaeon]